MSGRGTLISKMDVYKVNYCILQVFTKTFLKIFPDFFKLSTLRKTSSKSNMLSLVTKIICQWSEIAYEKVSYTFSRSFLYPEKENISNTNTFSASPPRLIFDSSPPFYTGH